MIGRAGRGREWGGQQGQGQQHANRFHGGTGLDPGGGCTSEARRRGSGAHPGVGGFGFSGGAGAVAERPDHSRVSGGEFRAARRVRRRSDWQKLGGFWRPGGRPAADLARARQTAGWVWPAARCSSAAPTAFFSRLITPSSICAASQGSGRGGPPRRCTGRRRSRGDDAADEGEDDTFQGRDGDAASRGRA